jgi:hypothetical protein
MWKLTDLIVGVLAGTPHRQVSGRKSKTTVLEIRMEVMTVMPKRMMNLIFFIDIIYTPHLFNFFDNHFV